ncbi:hypothetical protein EII19_00690 [Comamonadaceae bacterium OH2310_COT-174]|nr:hypothetical protein EII19_00690 [Comamonadaceae bacterium OH2310_COT-174]
MSCFSQLKRWASAHPWLAFAAYYLVSYCLTYVAAVLLGHHDPAGLAAGAPAGLLLLAIMAMLGMLAVAFVLGFR